MKSYISNVAFGREAEYLVALYLISRGWDVRMSKGSRGPADIVALFHSVNTKMILQKWLIQVKSSINIPRIKGYEISRLSAAATLAAGEPVIAIVQPKSSGETAHAATVLKGPTQDSYSVSNSAEFIAHFFSLPSWGVIRP